MNPSRRTPALLALAIAALCLLGACSSKDETPPPAQPTEGRPETQAIRNTQAIGYPGKALANKVDDALRQNDKQVKKTETQLNETDPSSQ